MATMTNSSERETGTARVLWDQFSVNNRDIEAAIVKGLTEKGFDVEIEPNFKPGEADFPPMQAGSSIKVYGKVGGSYA